MDFSLIRRTSERYSILSTQTQIERKQKANFYSDEKNKRFANKTYTQCGQWCLIHWFAYFYEVAKSYGFSFGQENKAKQ